MSLVLKFSDWPETDQNMWHALFVITGPLDESGALAHLRQTSRDTLQAHYGRWLGWLAATHPDVLDLAPPQRASTERLDHWQNALSHTKPMSQWSFISDTVRVLRAADPNGDWNCQSRLVKHLQRLAGRGDKKRKAGRVLGSDVLLQAGLDLVTSAAGETLTPLAKLQRRRDGAMIAFLALLPIRRRAFAGLTLGESIYFSPTSIRIALPEELTKTGVPWEANVPEVLEALIRGYHDEVRPALMAQRGQIHNTLWVGDRGKPYQLNHLGRRIGDITTKMLGVRVSPHLFRDAAATTLSRRSPDAARLIPPVLAHSSNLTSQRHYIHSSSIEAGRGLASVIDNKRAC